MICMVSAFEHGIHCTLMLHDAGVDGRGCVQASRRAERVDGAPLLCRAFIASFHHYACLASSRPQLSFRYFFPPLHLPRLASSQPSSRASINLRTLLAWVRVVASEAQNPVGDVFERLIALKADWFKGLFRARRVERAVVGASGN